jgi:hypothetical protein
MSRFYNLPKVTLESLASGETRELARVASGRWRALLFVRLSDEATGLVSAELGENGEPLRILGCLRLIGEDKLEALILAAETAKRIVGRAALSERR